MTRTELLALAAALANDVPELLREGLPQHALRVDTAQALLRKLAALQPVAWQERTQLSAKCWSEWYERTTFPAKAPRQIVSGDVTYQFRPVYNLSEVLSDE